MIIDRLFRSFENPATPLSDPANWLLESYGAETSAGIRVNETNALSYSAVAACVLVLSESVAQLPLCLHRKSGDRREQANDHPLHRLMHDSPNEQMTSMAFRSALQGHVLTWGNAYAFISFDQNGLPVKIIPLLPDRTFPVKAGDAIKYRSVVGGASVDLDPVEVLHIPGFSFDGVCGYSPIKLQREAIALGMAGQQFGGKLFSNGGTISGVLQHPGHFENPDARASFAKAWNNTYSGLSNARKTAVLEDGIEYKPIGMPATDAQLLETRKFSRSEVCGWYRVPPHMIGDLEKATFSNIEKQDIFFVKHTLLPWLQRWEQELNRKLLRDFEKKDYFFRFNVDGLLRGDSKTRAEAYQIGINSGWLTRNEVRELEDRDPIDGLDTVLEPLNMAPVGEESEQIAAESAPDSDDLARVLAQKALQRAANREAGAITRQIEKHGLDGWKEWLPDFYEKHAQWMRDVCGLPEGFVQRYVLSQIKQVNDDVSRQGSFTGFQGIEQWTREALAA